jgi:hypothetical protein
MTVGQRYRFLVTDMIRLEYAAAKSAPDLFSF